MKRSSMTFALVLWTVLTFTVSLANGTSHLRGFLIPQYKFATSNWLANYKESLISDLWVIPGTHNSGAIAPNTFWKWPAFLMAKDQTESLKRQMEFGIRSLDLRVAPLVSSDNKLSLHIGHTLITSLAFRASLEDVKSFVTSHPSEFILLSVRMDQASRNHPGLWEAMQSEIYDVLADTLYLPNADYDTLDGLYVKNVTSKVLLVTDEPAYHNDKLQSFRRTCIFAVNVLYRDSPSIALHRVADFLEISGPSGFFFRLFSWIENIFHYLFHFTSLKYDTTPRVVSPGQLGGMTIDAYGVYGIPPYFTSWIYTSYFKSWLMQSPRKLGLVSVDFATPELCESLFSQIRSL